MRTVWSLRVANQGPHPVAAPAGARCVCCAPDERELLGQERRPGSTTLVPKPQVSVPLSKADAGAPKISFFEKFRSAPTHDAISTNTATRNHFQRTHKRAAQTVREKPETAAKSIPRRGCASFATVSVAGAGGIHNPRCRCTDPHLTNQAGTQGSRERPSPQTAGEGPFPGGGRPPQHPTRHH